MANTEFAPDYQNLVDAAYNKEAKRLPLYEHIIDNKIIENVLGKEILPLLYGDYEDKKEYFRNYCEFYKKMGYDTVSFEFCIGSAMPGSGALGGHKEGVIKTMDDFLKYPFDEVPDIYFERYGEGFRALMEVMPDGMKAVGGPGNGIFECVQDIVGYMDLCLISADDPELYAMLFDKIGDQNKKIWQRFLKEYGDAYCVCRFGDDLGYKNNTLISDTDIKKHIIPQYKKIIDVVHSYNKPFLLHSCGCIFSVMDDIIAAGIDAKHSNEDAIAPFPEWVERYGDKIGNFGGIDTDAVCRLSRAEMKEYIEDVVQKCTGHGGFAFGSGNSIAAYVPVESFVIMTEIVRELRGE